MVFSQNSLEDFVSHSLIIEEDDQELFCNNSLEIVWNLSKAHHLIKVVKQQFKNHTVINYNEMISRSFRSPIEREEVSSFREDSMNIDSS